MELSRPGAIGIGIRLGMFALVLWLGIAVFEARGDFVTGFESHMLWMLLPVAFYTNVLGLLFGIRTRIPFIVAASGFIVTILVGWMQGDPFGPMAGIFAWLWIFSFVLLLGPAFLLAAIMRTPGCEMRSYRHAWQTLRKEETPTTVCPGWIDKFDNMRVFGKY